nr:MAG: hypothetical protein [Bacteriophage sp.]
MLIRSKNKMHLVNIENGVVSAEGEGTVTFRAGKIRNVLGEYSSLKTALRVLDMIEEAYADEKVIRYTLALQEREFKNMTRDQLLLVRAGILEKAVFQMPGENDVEE